MSRLDELMAELHPGGVRFKPLGEVAVLVRGHGMPKVDFTDEGIGAIHYGQIYTHYGVWATETTSHVASATAAKLTVVEPGDVIITNTSENVEDVGKAVAWLGDDTIVTGGHATVIKHHEDPKYLSYWFQSDSFLAQKKALASGTKVIDVSAKQLAKVRIPLPRIEVQQEIARALDLFQKIEAELEVELRAELEGRRRQYACVRESLLASPDSGFQWTAMGELGQFIRGRRFTKKDVVEDGIPSIHYGEIYTVYDTATSTTVSHVRRDLAGQLRYAQPGDVVIAAVGETVEDVAKAVAWLGEEPVAIHDDTFLFRSAMNPKFVSYAMQTAAFHAQKNKYVARAKVKRLGGEALAKIAIPTPAIEEQDRIVEILDTFAALKEDLSASLRAELTARRTQYEFYRNALLTFEETAA